MAGTLHAELTDDGKQIVLMGVGDSWEQRRLGEVLKLITPALKKADPPVAVFAPCTWPTVVQLEHTFNGNGNGWWVPGPKLTQWILGECDARRPRNDPLPFELPEGCVPRGYQVDGARDLAYSGRGLDLSDPGVGKTVTAILGLAWRRHLGTDIFPCVVVAPSWGVARAWEEEIAKWMPGWVTAIWGGAKRTEITTTPLAALRNKVSTRTRNVLIQAGYTNAAEVRQAQEQGGLNSVRGLGPASRQEIAQALAGLASDDEPVINVYVTTYATARRDAADAKGPLVRLKPKAVIVDEAHMIGNPKALQTKAVQRIASKAATFGGASGTIVKNDLRDLWPPLKTMDRDSWPSGKRLTNRYCITGSPDYGPADIEGLDPAHEREFRDSLRGSMWRVAKADVLTQLPPKIYSVRWVAMPEAWRRAYDGMEADMLAELPDGQELPAMDVLTRMNHLGQMASSAFDVEVTEDPPDEYGIVKKHYHVVLKEPCWKADELLEIMAERRGYAPIVAFAPSRQLMVLAGKRAEKEGYRVGYYIGLGNGVTEKSRQQAKADFQDGKLDLLCVTTKAGGTGLTLTAAGTAVFLRRPWAFDDATQAEDRVHRIGSEHHETFEGVRGVEIIDVRTIKSVESRVIERLKEKGANLAELVGDPRIVRELLGGS
jgi:SNF2 family DNA or RNA helicase